MQQLGLIFRKDRRGGGRAGAGRKRLPAQLRHTPHRSRAKHQSANPVHVTLRASVRSLRKQFVVRTVLGALRNSNSERFRIAHYSVQENHVHLIVEADSEAALSTGMRSLMVRLAKRVNKLLFRRGRFWADRWHGNALHRATPSPQRTRLRAAKPQETRPSRNQQASASIDPLSSAQWFDGFADPIPIAPRHLEPRAVISPRTWLLRTGWRRHGLIRTSESPVPSHRS